MRRRRAYHHYHVCDVFLSYVLLGRVRSLYKKPIKPIKPKKPKKTLKLSLETLTATWCFPGERDASRAGLSEYATYAAA